MTKWAARTALGLSTSFPGPVLLPENIISVEDKSSLFLRDLYLSANTLSLSLGSWRVRYD